MLRSMTGYGAGAADHGGAEVRVEMKGVNSRYFDFNLRIPRAYISMEEELKRKVQSRVSRGKTDVFVTIDTTKSASAIPRVNIEAATAYMAAILELKRGIEQSGISADALTGDISAAELLRLPDVLSSAADETDSEELQAAITKATELALAAFDDMRVREGERLLRDLSSKLDDVSRLAEQVERRAPEITAAYTARLRAKLEEALDGRQPDEARLLTEIAIFADKTATDEETVRLRSHITEMRDTLGFNEPVGRKLDFIIQEMNREVNTIGSKANDGETTRIVIELKSELEKLREQAQNIE
ncbi:MAG: YicC family protein [Oscillospiraceae bacterium]|nr:YicC family protein [Oscillospiraceae bacterium]